jgi:hypothetical protein
MITDIISSRLDALLVRGTQVEAELMDRVDAALNTSVIRPAVPQPLESPPDVRVGVASAYIEQEEADIPTEMPTAQSRRAAALLQLQEAISSIRVCTYSHLYS